MKKMIFTALIGLLVVGCATIQAQYNLYEQMKTYIFEYPADKVYAAAEDVFNNQSVGLKIVNTGNNTGITNWKQGYKAQGSLSHYESYRYQVAVIPMGTARSTLRVNKESVPDKKDPVTIGKMLGSEMLSGEVNRDLTIEFLILETLDAKAAAQLKAKAEKM